MSTPDPNPRSRLTSLTAWLPLLWLSLAFLCGILFASQVSASLRLWLLLAGGAALLALLVRLLFTVRASRWILGLLALALFFLGAARYRVSVPRVDSYNIAWYSDRDYELVITGTLTAPPDDRDTYSNLRLDVTQVYTGTAALTVHGLILARVPSGGDWHYGDVVRIRGHLLTPPSGEYFSYRDFLSRQGILAYMPDAKPTLLPFTAGSAFLRLVYGFREAAIARVYQIFPDPEASLVAGILLGDDSGLPAALQQAYKNTGTAHIIAISGFNIAIIAGLFVTLFSRLFGRRKGAIISVIGILLYTILVGAGPSVVRAAIMGGLSILALQLGRRQNGLNTLAFTAGVMALINPNTLWDVGFQLSVAATLGLVLYAQPLQDWFTRLVSRRLPPATAARIAAPVGEYVLLTLAAQVTTLPVMAYQFGRISLVSFIANPFILPAQPPVMILSGLALLFGLIYLPLGKLFGWIAWPFVAYTDRVVQLFNTLPHGVIVLGEFSLLFVVLYYLVLLGLTFAGPRVRSSLRPVLVPSTLIVILAVASYLAWSAAFAAPDGLLHLTFLDVGSADAVLIQTPSGRSLLINGGASGSQLSSALGQRLPLFARSLDWLVVAATDENEVAALPLTLDRFPPAAALWSGQGTASYSAGQLQEWLTTYEVPVTQAAVGAKLDLGDGALLTVSSLTPRGAVLLVEWQGFRALLPIGMNLDTLTNTDNGQTIGPVTALLLSDSGLGQLNPSAWLANLHPQVVILPVQAADPNNLPTQSVLDSLTGVTLLRTDRNGWISLSTDGASYWVDVEKK